MRELLNVMLVIGTRPEIIKMAPVVAELKRREISSIVVWTAQNSNKFLGQSILNEFGYDWSCIKKTDGLRFEALIQLIEGYRPNMMLVQGDTTTAALAALAAVYTKVRLGHIEAGLRSGDLRMREERNRIAIDDVSDLLFCPTFAVESNCSHCKGKTFVVGNTIADVLQGEKKVSKKKQIVVTLHRPELVDNPDLLYSSLQALATFAEKKRLSVVFPIHPRTASTLTVPQYCVMRGFDLRVPVSAHEMWQLINESEYVVTDSGGIQEEACIIGTPCFTFRPNTERQETLVCGANKLIEPGHSEDMVEKMMQSKFPTTWRHLYGSGVASKIINILEAENETEGASS